MHARLPAAEEESALLAAGPKVPGPPGLPPAPSPGAQAAGRALLAHGEARLRQQAMTFSRVAGMPARWFRAGASLLAI